VEGVGGLGCCQGFPSDWGGGVLRDMSNAPSSVPEKKKLGWSCLHGQGLNFKINPTRKDMARPPSKNGLRLSKKSKKKRVGAQIEDGGKDES